MAYAFGDGFDYYNAAADFIAGYWDTGNTIAITAKTAPRFAGGYSVSFGAGAQPILQKSSGVNGDAVHHINVAYLNTAALTGTSNRWGVTLHDGTTAQCTIAFRSDGSIQLQTGAIGGAQLALYNGAITTNTWTTFEIEVVIHPSAGSITVRKNGNASNDHQTTGLNTRVSANSYANQVRIVTSSPNLDYIDDFLWRSDASSLAWIGDVRAYVSMPTGDVSTQFSRAPNPPQVSNVIQSTQSFTAGTAVYTPFTASFSGTVGTAVLSVNVGYTGNMKVSMFSNTLTGNPGNVLGSATTIANPVAGNNTFTFPSPIAVTKGTQYWIGLDPDTTSGSYNRTTTGGYNTLTAYASFPVSNPTINISTGSPSWTVSITPTTSAEYVQEAQQDGTTTYVYDSVVGHADLYDLADLPGPATIYAVTTRGFMAKSDAGSRSGQLQIRSGSVGTTWNPSDKVSTIVLSNGNLTASGGVSSVGNVRSTGTVATGLKFYFEQTYVTPTTGIIGVGIANSSAVVNTNNYANTAFITDGGNIFINGSNTGINLGAFTTGVVIGIAVDLANYLIWFRVGPTGNWNGNASYSPGGTGGQSISAFMTGVPAYGYLAYNSSGAVVTANFGGSAFAGAVPSGFATGFFVGTTVQTTPLVLSSSFLWNFRTDTVNPNGGAAWTASAVNALQVGPVVQA